MPVLIRHLWQLKTVIFYIGVKYILFYWAELKMGKTLANIAAATITNHQNTPGRFSPTLTSALSNVCELRLA
jgi:hypothetical protein